MKPGALIGGKYRLVRQIGEGAMGVVWSAVNELTTREVALKLVLKSTDDLRHRLLREARACGGLSHRNIIEVYDVGQTETGDPFLVMQLLSGETLADLLARQRRLDPPLVAQIGRDVARALAAAHAAQIIHRDLKPANIFLHREAGTEGTVVKVLDFGVSKNLAATEALTTVVGGFVGSPAYMSPEQVRAEKNLDHRTDIWSLGVILFEMLTGVRPFQGTGQEIVQKILTAEIPAVSRLVRFTDPGLVELISRCLDRDRSKRIGSAVEIAQILQTHATSESSRVNVSMPQRPAASSSPNMPAVSPPAPGQGAGGAFHALVAQANPPRAAATSQPSFPAVTGPAAAAPAQAQEARSAYGGVAQQAGPVDPLGSSSPHWPGAPPHAPGQEVRSSYGGPAAHASPPRAGATSQPNFPAIPAGVQGPYAPAGYSTPAAHPPAMPDPRSQGPAFPATNPAFGGVPSSGHPQAARMPAAPTALLPNTPGAPWVPTVQPGAAASGPLAQTLPVDGGPHARGAAGDSGDFTNAGTLRMTPAVAAAAVAAVRQAQARESSSTTSTAAVVHSPGAGAAQHPAGPHAGVPSGGSARAGKKSAALIIAMASALVTVAAGGLYWFVLRSRAPGVVTTAAEAKPPVEPKPPEAAPAPPPANPPPTGSESSAAASPSQAVPAVPPAVPAPQPPAPAPGTPSKAAPAGPAPLGQATTAPGSPPAPQQTARPPSSIPPPQPRPVSKPPPCKPTFLKKCP